MTCREDVIDFLTTNNIAYETEGESFVVATVPGVARHNITVALSCGDKYLRVESFIARNPDENHQSVYRWLLEQNIKMFIVRYAVDHLGDIYLTGSMPSGSVNATMLDDLFGAIVTAADGSFNTLLELGFRSAIEREWAWRTSSGLSTENLAAFTHLFNEAT